MRRVGLTMLTMVLLAATAAHAETPEMIDVYTSGEDGYHTYRIPAMVATPQGTLLAFAEGRKHGHRDSGDIDLLVKRSTDGGRTWSEQQVVWDDGENTCGNPCPVIDGRTGTIWLAMTHNPGNYREARPNDPGVGTRTAWMTRSDDDGLSWSEPVEITSAVKDAEWLWYATGPGVGIQLQRGVHAGRLVIPANYSRPQPGQADRESTDRELGALAILSDDGGQTWRRSRETIEPRMNESQLVELSDGRVMTNMRSYFGDKRRRYAISEDGGETWSPPIKAEELVEPVCQASILRYDWPGDSRPGRILFSNPAHETKRVAMTIRASEDDGMTWPIARTLFEGTSGYSSLVVLPDGRIGCFFERRVSADAPALMTLAIFDMAWLTAGD